jgi:ketosteroid isomerase-like protein
LTHSYAQLPTRYAAILQDVVASEDSHTELVRRHYAAYDRGDIDGIVETLHPEVEIVAHDPENGGADRVWYGRTAARGLFVEIKSLIADNRAEIRSLEEREGRVQVSLSMHGVRRDTGEAGPLPAVHIHDFRDGLIARIETYRPEWRG